MAHLSCVLADAYIHELGENESVGRKHIGDRVIGDVIR
jgi:hypothetical protein